MLTQGLQFQGSILIRPRSYHGGGVLYVDVIFDEGSLPEFSGDDIRKFAHKIPDSVLLRF